MAIPLLIHLVSHWWTFRLFLIFCHHTMLQWIMLYIHCFMSTSSFTLHFLQFIFQQPKWSFKSIIPNYATPVLKLLQWLPIMFKIKAQCPMPGPCGTNDQLLPTSFLSCAVPSATTLQSSLCSSNMPSVFYVVRWGSSCPEYSLSGFSITDSLSSRFWFEHGGLLVNV